MKARSFVIVVLLVCSAVALAGCTGSGGSSGPAGGSSPQAGTTSAQDNLVPSPTDSLPSQNVISVIVKEKDYAGKIPVEFDGGMGQIHVKKIDVTLYRADGQTRTATVGNKKGDSVELEGTKQTDRVVVYVTFDNGDYKKTNDVLSPYRSRG
ncbi:MAG: hypothetical protein GYA23_05395 [Methanomicrobiales archaeon]|nr:hypothetical protein [Methanomicrobiales archaeon]